MKTLTKETHKLSAHQQEVFTQIVSQLETKVSSILKSTHIEDYLLSLTGPAGTGKTFLTTQIAKYLMQKRKESEYPMSADFDFIITAPTHKAVGVLSNLLRENNIQTNCKTIHSFLGIKPFIDYTTGEERFVVDKTKKTKDRTSILIVDESSMIGSTLYEYILEAIEDRRVNVVLFIGDPYQLLPVDNSRNEIYDLPNRFFLSEVVRQAEDSYIIKVATKLRERIKNQDFINLQQFFQENKEKEITFFHNKEAFLEDFYKEETWHKENKILATYKNKDVDAFNKNIRNKYWEQKGNNSPSALLAGDMIRFKDAYTVGDITIYHNGEELELGSAELKYHDSLHIEYWECKSIYAAEQQVFRVVNPDSEAVFNQKLQALATKAKQAKFPNNKKLWKLYYETRNMFANVQYIHASTIHKLQGSTYDVSYIDMFSLANNHYMSDEEKYRLVYVAITRASQDIKIFISAFDRMSDEHGTVNRQKIEGTNTLKQLHEIDDILKNFDL
ncbi:MAG: AAA family ATPase [Sulfurimonas sp.]|nr:AAA family ATPase [Sulfurimonas sp.]